MKREFLPFYISRAILSLVFALLVMGINWHAMLFAAILFGLFLLYLHSGWFSIDLRYPLMPLRRDQRGQEVQRKALITAVIVGVLVHFTSSHLAGVAGLSLSGNVALSIGIITYFVAQFVLFVRA